ncbi:MAG: lipoyl synthase [Candidatus Cloacimonetes bacterium]|nr:lipoyl synthase [Candidatus Cloacimonadota bacterium]MBS3767017.1 lipoyl synthase [Candidatus Cloacimonadota bacterium]
MATKRKPEWLTANVLGASKKAKITRLMKNNNLHTVCQSARCPNRGECFEKGTAVFLILGDTCTRDCRFCAIPTAKDLPSPDKNEPVRVARTAKNMGLNHVIITSVTRDDLEDGGAEIFVSTIDEIRKVMSAGTTIEVLTPDFKGNYKAVDKIVDKKPLIFNHNLETVESLYSHIRPQADYDLSMDLLKYVKKRGKTIFTKTGIMVGLGETKKQVKELLDDARRACVDMLTIGQYLQADKRKVPVKEYIHPKTFNDYKSHAEKIGFRYVESAPLVRSSYYSKNVTEILKDELS